MLHSTLVLARDRGPRPDHRERSDRSQYVEIEQRALVFLHTVQQATHSTFPRDHRSQRYAFYVCRDERDSFRFSCAPVTSALMRAPWNTGAHLSCRRSPPHSWRHSYGQHISTSSSVARFAGLGSRSPPSSDTRRLSSALASDFSRRSRPHASILPATHGRPTPGALYTCIYESAAAPCERLI